LTELAGWGRYPRHETELVAPSPEAVTALLAERTGLVVRGNGRAYGDAAVGERITVASRRLDRMRRFDPVTGHLTVEAGVLLSEVIAALLPRGFFPAVVPGTKLVTIGGMIAADVHGKNHHRDGGFGDHVAAFRLAMPGGGVVTCSAEENAELFSATIGGMGLTGAILDATIRLRPVETGWLRQRTTVAPDLDAAMAALAESAGATYSVAWIDCLARGAALGRSVVYTAEHAARAELTGAAERDPLPRARQGRLGMPFDAPRWGLNRWSVRAFNEVYYRKGAAAAGTTRLVPWEPYFFPLDGIGDWNRIYGRRGFLQHQCVIPTPAAREALGDILERVARRGSASFLAVLKQLGPGRRPLSFPLAGYTLALDLPAAPETFDLLDEVDRVVVAAGGRLYLAKDARQSRETFEAGYPDLPAFRALRRAVGAEERIASRLSRRLGL
jgi:decaprenylphospho-beta-D-ribofuranose 2-oxidase